MTERRTVIQNISSEPEHVKCIERDQGYYTELMMKPVHPGETNATGSYLHFNSDIRITNGSVFWRNAHFDVYEHGRETREVPVENASAMVVTANDSVPASTAPTAMVPVDPAVSSMGYNGTHMSVDKGKAVAIFTMGGED